MDYSSYPDPGYNNHMFFTGNIVRRPQSTEPEDWALRNRHAGTQMNYGAHVQFGNEWNVGVNFNMPEVKTEKAYAL